METTSWSMVSPRLRQHGPQGAGHGGEDDVVDGAALGVGRGVDGAQVGVRDREGPAGADGPVQRAARRVGIAAGAQLGGGGPEPAQPRW